MPSSSGRSGLALLLGALSVVAVPGSVASTHFTSLGLLKTLYVMVPVDVVLALAALAAERRARFARARRVTPGSAAVARFARVVVYVGAYAALTSALALGVFGLLRWAE